MWTQISLIYHITTTLHSYRSLLGCGPTHTYMGPNPTELNETYLWIDRHNFLAGLWIFPGIHLLRISGCFHHNTAPGGEGSSSGPLVGWARALVDTGLLGFFEADVNLRGWTPSEGQRLIHNHCCILFSYSFVLWPLQHESFRRLDAACRIYLPDRPLGGGGLQIWFAAARTSQALSHFGRNGMESPSSWHSSNQRDWWHHPSQGRNFPVRNVLSLSPHPPPQTSRALGQPHIRANQHLWEMQGEAGGQEFV